MSDELKPCPFCGGAAEPWIHYARCSNVECFCNPQAQPIRQWNTRAPLSSWIPVAERMPEEDELVMVAYPNSVTVAYFDAFTGMGAGHTEPEGYWRDTSGQKCESPTHWQPLPSPPPEQKP